MEASVNGKNNTKLSATISLALFPLHCYSQVASIFTFIADDCVKLLLLKCLRSIETKELLVTIVVPKLQSLILRVTRSVVRLEHCFVPTVPISPENPRMI